VTLRIGVIGVGAIGRIHADHLASRVSSATLAGVADTNAEVAQGAAKRFKVKQFATDGEMFAGDAVDAVAICTPRQTHAGLIVQAATAGKHIFCEKPLASTLAEADEALAAVGRAGVVLQVGFQRRFDAEFRSAHEAIAGGSIGAPRIIHLMSRDPAPKDGPADRAPEDLVFDTTIHDFDVARYLGGAEIVSVQMTGLAAARPERLEGAVFVLELENGVIVTIENHLHSPVGYDQRAEVLASNGMAYAMNARTMIWGTEDTPFFGQRYSDAYIAEVEAFARSVLDGTPPLVTGADGRASVAAAVAALESLRVGRAVELGR
jgi:myo-inositol 2-dehydrogenase/D-chiro-inositol 1-dehydrogenase